MIRWENFSAISKKQKLHQQLQQAFNASTYGKEWTVKELIAEEDTRKHVIYMVLNGDQFDGRKVVHNPGAKPPISFRLRVLTRQACVRTADGAPIWSKASAREMLGSPSDPLPTFDEKPQPGDIVELKGAAITHDPDTGEPVDAKVLKKWSRQGKRPNYYFEFPVDKDGCITVQWPHVLSLLQKHGRHIAQPQFRKVDLREKGLDKDNFRKLTNWWFEEVTPQSSFKTTTPDADPPEDDPDEQPKQWKAPKHRR